MKCAFTLLPILCLLCVPAQTGKIFSVPQKPEGINISGEVKEAVRDFDFDKLRLNPNNLDAADIENLAANFLPAVKPYLI